MVPGRPTSPLSSAAAFRSQLLSSTCSCFPKWGIDLNLWMAPARMILCVRFAENATIFRR